MTFHFVDFMPMVPPRAPPRGELIYFFFKLFHVEVTYIVIICSEYKFEVFMMIEGLFFMFVYYLPK